LILAEHNVLRFDILVDYFEPVHHSQSEKQILLHFLNLQRTPPTELHRKLTAFFVDDDIKTKRI